MEKRTKMMTIETLNSPSDPFPYQLPSHSTTAALSLSSLTAAAAAGMQTPSNQKEKDPLREHELEPLYPSPPHNSLSQTHTMGGGHSLLDPVHPLLALPIEPAQSRHSNPSGQSNASSSIMAFTPETPYFDNAPIKFKSFNNTNSKSGFSNSVSDSGRVTRSQTKRKLEFQSGYHKTVNPICSPPIQQSSSKHNGSTKNFKNMPQIDFDASKYSTASAASIPSALSDYLNPTTNTQSKYSLSFESSTSQQRAPPPLRISTAEFCSSGYNDSSTSANHLAYSYPPNTQTEPQYQQQQQTYQSQHQNYHPLLTPSNGSNYIPGYPPTSYPTTHGPSSYLPQSPQTSTSFNHLSTTRYSDYTATSSVQSPMTLLNGIQNTSNSYGMSGGSSSNHFTATPSACLPIQQQDHTFPLSYPQQPLQQPSQMYHYPSGSQIYNQHQQGPNQPFPQSDISSLSSLYPQYQNAHQYLHSHQEHRHHLPPPTQQILPHQPSAAEPAQQQQRDIIQPQRSRYLPPPMPSSHYPALPRNPYTQPTQQYYQYQVQQHYPGPAAVVPNHGEVIDLTRSESPYEYGKKRKLDNGVLPAPVAGTSMVYNYNNGGSSQFLGNYHHHHYYHHDQKPIQQLVRPIHAAPHDQQYAQRALPLLPQVAHVAGPSGGYAQQQQDCDDKDGHYIVRGGEDLTSRYKIIRLLGQGTFGKVVEAIDRTRNVKVAIKIIRSIQKYRDAAKVEVRVLTTLKKHDPSNLKRCIHLISHFEHRNHTCMVFELLAQSLFDFLKDNSFSPFPMTHIQTFALQICEAVKFMHDLRLIHTDLKPENLMLEQNECLARIGTGPKQLVAPRLRLIDFGSAIFDEDYHSSVVSTRHYRAPEIILGLGWTFPCDMWSIGCILVEFFTGDALFQTHDNVEHLAMMQAVLGPIPQTLIKTISADKPSYKFFKHTAVGGSSSRSSAAAHVSTLQWPVSATPKASKKFVKNMRPLSQIIPTSLQLQQMGGGSVDCGGAQSLLQQQFYDLVKRMLVYDPKERITAAEALNHPFLKMRPFRG
ncbi:Dual specificity protein kinase clk3 [Chytriomyces hyalinus]|nr:Dual specificity protein kinase clk3 [Chytriomyces hyalinus]